MTFSLAALLEARSALQARTAATEVHHRAGYASRHLTAIENVSSASHARRHHAAVHLFGAATLLITTLSAAKLISIIQVRRLNIAPRQISRAAHRLRDRTCGHIPITMLLVIIDKTRCSMMGATALLHTANVLLAFTLFVGILHITIDLGVDPFLDLAARLAGLTVSALHRLFTVDLANYLAALLELAARNGTQASFDIGINHWVGGPSRRVHLLKGTIRTKAVRLSLHGRAGLFSGI